MSRIEDVMFVAYDLGIENKVFNLVKKLRDSDDNKYTSRADLYEEAFKKVINEEKSEN
jgi:hypothetical protein